MARKPRDFIDETDIRILQLLLNDGRKPNSEMARVLGLPDSTDEKPCTASHS
ncbi:MAG TPA: AsnC family transcriptional regulator [Dehalococcoidia bacterium]|nr:AsnC family transcriptional regulator [Dehalococcoidia bacterium]